MELQAVEAIKARNRHHQPTIFDYAISQGIELMIDTPTDNDYDDIEKALPVGLRMTKQQKRQLEVFENEVKSYPQANTCDQAYRSLAAAVVINALMDAKGSDSDLRREANYWLSSDTAALFFEVLGVTKEGLNRWYSNGQPTSIKKARRIYDN